MQTDATQATSPQNASKSYDFPKWLELTISEMDIQLRIPMQTKMLASPHNFPANSSKSYTGSSRQKCYKTHNSDANQNPASPQNQQILSNPNGSSRQKGYKTHNSDANQATQATSPQNQQILSNPNGSSRQKGYKTHNSDANQATQATNPQNQQILSNPNGSSRQKAIKLIIPMQT